MRPKACFILATAAALATASFLATRNVDACGGCFNVSRSRSPSQVTSHRMALSISQDQTTLWDQIQYVGEPEEFAWVLPIRGQVQVGLSSDLLFAQLEALTAVTIKSPVVQCPSFGSGGSGDPCSGTTGSKAAAGGGGVSMQDEEGGDVDVLAQQVVGPYDTVQLSSDDPLALRTWLESHGYAIPADVEPVIDAYVAEGFDFLALRLVPGASVDAMRPVRVTSQGASPALPLRMVAAGTGPVTAISLFVIGEGRYEPTNAPVGRIDEADLVWDFGSSRSNYAELREAYFDANPTGWLKEASFDLGGWELDPVLDTAQTDPAASGYGGPTGDGAYAEALADIATVFAGIRPISISLTRVNAELSRAGLESDLSLGASFELVSTTLEASDYVGNACSSISASCHDGEGGGDGYDDGSTGRDACTCTTTAGSTTSLAGFGLAGLAATMAARRARRRRQERGAR